MDTAASHLFGTASGVGRGGFAAYFGAFIARPLDALFWQLLVVVSAVGIVVVGVRRGIEALNRVLMPLLAMIVLLLAGSSLSLPGAGAGRSRAWLFLLRFVAPWLIPLTLAGLMLA